MRYKLNHEKSISEEKRIQLERLANESLRQEVIEKAPELSAQVDRVIELARGYRFAEAVKLVQTIENRLDG